MSAGCCSCTLLLKILDLPLASIVLISCTSVNYNFYLTVKSSCKPSCFLPRYCLMLQSYRVPKVLLKWNCWAHSTEQSVHVEACPAGFEVHVQCVSTQKIDSEAFWLAPLGTERCIYLCRPVVLSHWPMSQIWSMGGSLWVQKFDSRRMLVALIAGASRAGLCWHAAWPYPGVQPWLGS